MDTIYSAANNVEQVGIFKSQLDAHFSNDEETKHLGKRRLSCERHVNMKNLKATGVAILLPILIAIIILWLATKGWEIAYPLQIGIFLGSWFVVGVVYVNVMRWVWKAQSLRILASKGKDLDFCDPPADQQNIPHTQN